eukprot:Phypoly_transcript_06412.p1 GENE.Phypoly_transcript_06412~~Phypoly_transcript_06412.p1  ORF type:complete len:447 (+),score=62.06 Phypoly_transcript_06412:390-1730(+)
MGHESKHSHLLSLPYECLLHILLLLSPKDVSHVQLVSKPLFLSAQDNLCWLKFCVEHLMREKEKRMANANKRSFFVKTPPSSPTKGAAPLPNPTPILVRKEITNLRYWKQEYKCYTQKPQTISFQASSDVWSVRHLSVRDSDSNHFRVASGCEDGTIHIFDTENPANAQTLGKHAESVLCLCGGGNGANYSWESNSSEDFLFSGSHDRSIKLWDLRTNSLVRNFVGHTGAVVCCAENGEHTIATGSGDSSVRMWDTRTSTQAAKILGHEGTILSLVVLDPDGRYILTSARDNTLRIWDTRTCAQVQLHHTAGPVRDMSYSKYATTLVTGGGYSRIPKLYLYNVNLEDKLVPRYKSLVKMLDPPLHMLGHSDAICSLTGDSTKVISASFDGSIRIWSKVYMGECVRTLNGHLKEVTGVHLNHDSTSFVSGSLDGTVKVWYWDTFTSL